ncbi:MAG: Asp-tRNA(Asn)/Glu-tRNA(Gln) amidotransferase subunit GatC [Candidatus Paceibacterota bacterium]
MASINRENLKHLTELARIEIEEKDEEKLLKDLQEILDYFEELKEVDTKNVESMSGGNIFLSNVFRNDTDSYGLYADLYGRNEKLKGVFPEEEDGFLKIPPVFFVEGGSASGGE